MSEVMAGLTVLGCFGVALIIIWKFSYPNKPKQSIQHLNELHSERVRVLESKGETFQINECKECEEPWPCTTKVVLNWIEKECK
jgi:hypothetical protein